MVPHTQRGLPFAKTDWHREGAPRCEGGSSEPTLVDTETVPLGARVEREKRLLPVRAEAEGLGRQGPTDCATSGRRHRTRIPGPGPTNPMSERLTVQQSPSHRVTGGDADRPTPPSRERATVASPDHSTASPSKEGKQEARKK